jgi:hypothetical protein
VASKDYKVAVNLDHPRQDLVDQAVSSMLAKGVSRSWLRQVGVADQRQYLDNGTANMPPSLFVKTKPGILPDEAAAHLRRIEQSGLSDEHKAHARAWHEVCADATHELQMAPALREVIQGDEAQALAQAHGFDGFSYVEPLAVATRQTTGEQALLYPWQPGQNATDPLAVGPGSFPRAAQPALHDAHTGLRGLLRASGIVATDLSSSQLIVQRRPSGLWHLYVKDTEQYYHAPKMSSLA